MAVFGDTPRLGASPRLARPEQVRGATQPQRTGTTERSVPKMVYIGPPQLNAFSEGA